MKLLKIDSKKCYYSIDGIDFKPIVDIAKEDIYSILNIIYSTDDFEIDEYNDTIEIENDVERLIYKNIYTQLNTFIQNKSNLVNEINTELEEIKEKYKNDMDDIVQ